jgi:hypothetical protein
MKMNKQRAIIKTMAGAMLALASSNAFAADGKDYPGMVCVPDQTSVPAGHVNGTAQVYAGTLMNMSSTEALFVTCPFVHDQNNIQSATIQIYDRSPSAEVSCTLHSEIDNSSGMTIFSSATVGSGVGSFSSVSTALSFGAVSTGNYNYAQCSIPKKDPTNGSSHVAGFTVVES